MISVRGLVAGFARFLAVVLLGLTVATSPVPARDHAGARAAKHVIPDVPLAELPREARETLKLMQQSGPFPYERDGVVFGNFEKRLPLKERGYYREYTVRTPGVKHRGARRIVAGREGELYYTEDHYQSFKRIRE